MNRRIFYLGLFLCIAGIIALTTLPNFVNTGGMPSSTVTVAAGSYMSIGFNITLQNSTVFAYYSSSSPLDFYIMTLGQYDNATATNSYAAAEFAVLNSSSGGFPVATSSANTVGSNNLSFAPGSYVVLLMNKGNASAVVNTYITVVNATTSAYASKLPYGAVLGGMAFLVGLAAILIGIMKKQKGVVDSEEERERAVTRAYDELDRARPKSKKKKR